MLDAPQRPECRTRWQRLGGENAISVKTVALAAGHLHYKHSKTVELPACQICVPEGSVILREFLALQCWHQARDFFTAIRAAHCAQVHVAHPSLPFLLKARKGWRKLKREMCL